MPKENTKLEDARRQGQFEGEVKTKLNNIDYKVDDLVKTVGNANTLMDGRVRKIEETIGDLPDLRKHIENVTSNVDNLVRYQSMQRGIIIGLGVLSTIITPIVTALILRQLTR